MDDIFRLVRITGVPAPLKFINALTLCAPPEMFAVLAEVMRPRESTVSTGIAALEPKVPGVTPLAGSWAVASVPDVMLLALVVFVVAEAASPLICDVLIVGICDVARIPVICAELIAGICEVASVPVI